MKPENLYDMIRGVLLNRRRPKMVNEEINTIINVTYGGFVFAGDYRCIAPTMKAIEETVIPLMEKGNETAAKLGILPSRSPDDGRGYD